MNNLEFWHKPIQETGQAHRKSMNVISLGVGVQSTALYYMSSMGQIPRADFAIFADPGREKRKTYEYLEFLQDWSAVHNGIPILVKKDKNLFMDLLSGSNSTGGRFASIPAFTEAADGSAGMLLRQCTNEYKIQVVDNAIRDLYGLKKRQRRPQTFVWMGITLDELERMAQPAKNNAWRINTYPFTGFSFDRNNYSKLDWAVPLSRIDLYAWYRKMGLPIPPKSGCLFCPYRGDADWLDMKVNDPEDFAAAVLVDYSFRNSSKKGIKNPIYLHRSLKPLDEVNFDPSSSLFHAECSGNCHY